LQPSISELPRDHWLEGIRQAEGLLRQRDPEPTVVCSQVAADRKPPVAAAALELPGVQRAGAGQAERYALVAEQVLWTAGDVAYPKQQIAWLERREAVGGASLQASRPGRTGKLDRFAIVLGRAGVGALA
jgi:hypothetical protein